MGVDFAGTITAVGSKVTRYKIGDDVFGGRGGAFGEYLVIPESRAMTLKPDNVSFEEAAAVPIAAVTALQALRERNLTLDWWPVGSGPFMMVVNNPNSEIVLERNPNFREDFYPTEGGPGDLEMGLLFCRG